ncbi:guanine nucleotide exchange factor DBS [Elysia marginata]|uniref:Guanine nucleotide exchange factor DBS n=1 Tax=Elysia marginata TaxID=1093978 RepID=A0AAV4HBV3_9GAST|nr:guanine nucleotide exchange factor DBS [Elysia marginata]
MTAETRANVQHILKRMEDVQGMCAKRKESLRTVIGPSKTRPTQQVRQEPSSQTDAGQGPDLKKPVIHAEKSARFRPDHQHQSNSSDTVDSSFNTSHNTSSQSASDTSSSVASDTQRSSVSSVSMSSFPEGDSPKSKQRHIMNELIETEEAYVNELYQIIQGYYNKMDDKSLLMMVPPAVLGQKHVLFSNLVDIYCFHNNVFLNELKECRDSPSRVGKIFVNRECQRQLGHRLPLGAYLLKPIQRITKYQLLLKAPDMATKDLWIKEIKRVLLSQFDHLKDMATKDVWIKEIKRVLLSQFDHLKANRQLLSGTPQGLQISTDSDLSLDNWRSSGDEGDTTRGNNNNSKSSSLTRNVPAISAPCHPGQEGERVGTGGVGGAGEEDFNDEDGGWSSGEFSNTDDEQLDEQYIPKIEPSYCERFVSLGDYYPTDSTELGLTEGDEVEVQRVGTNGWWYARHMTTGGQGWVPSTYLEPISRQQHGVSSSNSEGNLFSSSDSLCVAGARGEMSRSASGRHYYRSNSPVPETTV